MVVDKLKKEKIWDNTLLFFLTDNGGAAAMDADNGHLRDFKQSVYEGGIRTPWMVSWPDRFKGGRVVDTPIISFDILPTVMDALGESPPEAKDFDGKSILPLIEGKSKTHHEVLYWDTADPKKGWAVRKGDWKLKGDAKAIELYDLKKDPSEATDLAQRNPEKVKSLHALYKAWRAEMPVPDSERPKAKK